MLIVTPPKKEKIAYAEEVSSTKQESILDFNELDVDYLDVDYLGEDELEFTELDINFLDVNYLEDLLNVLDALAIAEDEDALAQATSTQISGTLIR